MGILSWWRGSDDKQSQPENSKPSANPNSNPNPNPNPSKATEAPGMNGAVEVPRPTANITVFEFGSVAASADKVTLTGYCPVSDDLEPCRWEILPASGPDAPQFRVAF